MRQTSLRLLLGTATLLVLAACASSSSGGAPAAAPRTSTQTMGGSDVGRLAVTTVVDADVISVPFDADAVFKVLPSVYDSLGVVVNLIDPARKQVGNSALKIRNRLGKNPLSYYLDCGSGQIGPNADSYDVVLSVSTTVSSGGAGQASLATLLDAQARPATYNQAYSRCGSKGLLEQKIADAVAKKLRK